MAFLTSSEVLVEVGDDLTDYEENVERNAFNVYRCFLALYGPEQGRQELRSFIAATEGKYSEGLSGLQPPRLGLPLSDRVEGGRVFCLPGIIANMCCQLD